MVGSTILATLAVVVVTAMDTKSNATDNGLPERPAALETQCHTLLGVDGQVDGRATVVFCQSTADNGTVRALTRIGASQVRHLSSPMDTGHLAHGSPSSHRAGRKL